MRNRSIWNVSCGLLLVATGFTALAKAEGPSDAYRSALKRLSPPNDRHSSADYSAAIRLFDRVIETRSSHKGAYRCRGLARVLTGDPEAAIRDFDRALQIDPTDAVLYYGRGWAYALLGKTRAALADFKEAVHRRPGYAAAMAAQGTMLGKLGMWRERNRIWELEANLPAPKENEELTYFCDCTDFADGRQFDLSHFFVTPFWSMIYTEYGGLQRLAAETPLADKGVTEAETLRQTALLQAVRRDLDTALATIERAIVLSPEDWRSYRLRAAIWAIRDDPRRALISLNKAIEFNPNEAKLYMDRSRVNRELDDTDAADRDGDEVDRITDEKLRAWRLRSKEKKSGKSNWRP